MKILLAIIATLTLSGCITATVQTPYGSVTRTAAGKTIVELDVRGFAK